MDKFIRAMEDAGRKGTRVSVVVKAVEHALSARELRTRYPVGRGIRLMVKVSNLLPDEWTDQLLEMRT